MSEIDAPVLAVGGGPRGASRLDHPDPAVAAVPAAAVWEAAPAGPVWLGGGEPTLRADLLELLAGLRARGATPGLETDGEAFVLPGVPAALAGAGVRALRVALHSPVAAAHDWLVGRPGAAKRALRAVSLARDAGLHVDLVATVTRPTMDHLPALGALAAGAGVRALRLRRLRASGPAAAGFITLAPRYGLMEPLLEECVARAAAAGVRVRLDGLPRCAAPRAPAAAFRAEAGPHAPGCPACPGAPLCGGAPADYTAVFGRAEFDSEAGTTPGRPVAAPPVPGVAPAPPPARHGRAPATRLRAVRRQAAFPDLGGDPQAGEPPRHPPPATVTLRFAGPTRALRAEVLRLAQERPGAIRVADDASIAHPAAAELLRECLRAAPVVEIEADLRPLAHLPEPVLAGLRGLRARHTGPPDPAAEALTDRLHAWAASRAPTGPAR